MTVKVIDSEKVCLSNMQNLQTVCEHIDCWFQFSLLNRDKLTEPIQMQLSKKEKAFSEFFPSFLKFKYNFEHFHQKDDVHVF